MRHKGTPIWFVCYIVMHLYHSKTEEHGMSAYIIVEAIINHPEAFTAYAKAVPPVVAQFGGEYKILGGQTAALER